MPKKRSLKSIQHGAETQDRVTSSSHDVVNRVCDINVDLENTAFLNSSGLNENIESNSVNNSKRSEASNKRVVLVSDLGREKEDNLEKTYNEKILKLKEIEKQIEEKQKRLQIVQTQWLLEHKRRETVSEANALSKCSKTTENRLEEPTTPQSSRKRRLMSGELEYEQDLSATTAKIFKESDEGQDKQLSQIKDKNGILAQISKVSPKFSGSKKIDHETFETWLDKYKLVLDEFQCSDRLKIAATKLVLSGAASQLVMDSTKNIKNVNDIFDILKRAYGKDDLEIEELYELKQYSEETIKAFFARLEAKLSQLNIPKGNFALRLFLNNVKPEYIKQLKATHSEDLDEAYIRALSIEREHKELHGTIKNKKPVQENINVINTVESTANETIPNTVNMIQQHLTGNQFKKLNSQIDSCKDMITTNCVSSIQALNEQLTNLCKEVKNNSINAFGSAFNNRNTHVNHNDKTRSNYNKEANNLRPTPYGNSQNFRKNNLTQEQYYKKLKCFNCQDMGHPYYKCPTITEDKRRAIEENKDKLIEEYRSNKNSNNNLNA